MPSQAKFTTIIIWFAILAGLFIILEFAAGGITSLSGEFKIQSMALMLVGFIPPVVSVIGRILIIPKANTYESFMPIFVVCLALCEGPAIVGMFVFPQELITERAFAFIGAVLGIMVLCPVGMAGPWNNQPNQ